MTHHAFPFSTNGLLSIGVLIIAFMCIMSHAICPAEIDQYAPLSLDPVTSPIVVYSSIATNVTITGCFPIQVEDHTYGSFTISMGELGCLITGFNQTVINCTTIPTTLTTHIAPININAIELSSDNQRPLSLSLSDAVQIHQPLISQAIPNIIPVNTLVTMTLAYDGINSWSSVEDYTFLLGNDIINITSISPTYLIATVTYTGTSNTPVLTIQDQTKQIIFSSPQIITVNLHPSETVITNVYPNWFPHSFVPHIDTAFISLIGQNLQHVSSAIFSDSHGNVLNVSVSSPSTDQYVKIAIPTITWINDQIEPVGPVTGMISLTLCDVNSTALVSTQVYIAPPPIFTPQNDATANFTQNSPLVPASAIPTNFIWTNAETATTNIQITLPFPTNWPSFLPARIAVDDHFALPYTTTNNLWKPLQDVPAGFFTIAPQIDSLIFNIPPNTSQQREEAIAPFSGQLCLRDQISGHCLYDFGPFAITEAVTPTDPNAAIYTNITPKFGYFQNNALTVRLTGYNFAGGSIDNDEIVPILQHTTKSFFIRPGWRVINYHQLEGDIAPHCSQPNSCLEGDYIPAMLNTTSNVTFIQDVASFGWTSQKITLKYNPASTYQVGITLARQWTNGTAARIQSDVEQALHLAYPQWNFGVLPPHAYGEVDSNALDISNSTVTCSSDTLSSSSSCISSDSKSSPYLTRVNFVVFPNSTQTQLHPDAFITLFTRDLIVYPHANRVPGSFTTAVNPSSAFLHQALPSLLTSPSLTTSIAVKWCARHGDYRAQCGNSIDGNDLMLYIFAISSGVVLLFAIIMMLCFVTKRRTSNDNTSIQSEQTNIDKLSQGLVNGAGSGAAMTPTHRAFTAARSRDSGLEHQAYYSLE